MTAVRSPMALVREDLLEFAGYRSARSEKITGSVWLNANEAARDNAVDFRGSLRRYPEPQPARLRQLMADAFGCRSEQLLAGRGSDEGIDLLVRALCRPGRDAVLVTTPTFGMYAVCARLHGARVVDVPLVDRADGFHCDFAAVAEAAEANEVKLVFLCSPGNPTGTLLPLAAILALAERLQGRALVVVDEAYIDYAQAPSAVSLIDAQRNVAVLRTLSKAHALAAARIGAVIADAELVGVLQRCQAPYPLPAPCVELACAALEPTVAALTAAQVTQTVAERERLFAAVGSLGQGVQAVYPSRANFVLARFADAQAAFEQLLHAGIVVRDMRAAPQLGNALRISVGSPAENALVADALRAQVPA